MNKLELSGQTKRKELYRTCPKESDATQLIDGSTEFWRDGKRWLSYIEGFPMESLRLAVQEFDKKIAVNRRQSGVPSMSKTFGCSPRAPVQQRDYCYQASLHRENPAAGKVLIDYAEKFSNLLRESYPEQAEVSAKATAGVLKHWLMGESLFTSGIINKENPLQYHYDAGNFEGTWSVMAVFKKDIVGGHLILPEYGVKIACKDSSLLIFDGQSELHGVSPISKMSAQAYRYSVVFYSLEKMSQCGTPTEEIRRAQIQRTKTEMKRAGLVK